MDKQFILDKVMCILSGIKPDTSIVIEENIFGAKNNFTSRDVAYALLEMEQEFGINIELLIQATESFDGFTIQNIINMIAEQKISLHDKRG